MENDQCSLCEVILDGIIDQPLAYLKEFLLYTPEAPDSVWPSNPCSDRRFLDLASTLPRPLRFRFLAHLEYLYPNWLLILPHLALECLLFFYNFGVANSLGMPLTAVLWGVGAWCWACVIQGGRKPRVGIAAMVEKFYGGQTVYPKLPSRFNKCFEGILHDHIVTTGGREFPRIASPQGVSIA